MKRRHSSALSFVDFLFNLLLAFVSLFILSFLLINPVTQDKKIDPNAEFLVILSWPGEINDDIDLWAEDPQGNVVYFGRKEAGLMHLDRDDLGHINDKIENANGEIVDFEYNQETLTVRGYIPGEYVINVFMFSKRSKFETPATIQVIKLNPYRSLAEKTIRLSKDGQEETVIRFTVDSSGKVIGRSSLPKTLSRTM